MNDEQIIEVTEAVLRKTALEQKALLKTGRVERAFSTRLRDKLLPIFATNVITVDAPYNRHGEDKKRLNGGTIELDVAIHEPFSDNHNVLAIEMKTQNKPKDENDIEKLKGLTLENGDYRYQLGLFVVFGIEAKAGEVLKMVWYKNGQEL